jgi:hypothetical protein
MHALRQRHASSSAGGAPRQLRLPRSAAQQLRRVHRLLLASEQLRSRALELRTPAAAAAAAAAAGRGCIRRVALCMCMCMCWCGVVLLALALAGVWCDRE